METGVRKSLSKLKEERGQNLVEFALIVVLFFVLFFGIIEFGRYWWRGNLLKGAANKAARTYAVRQNLTEAKQAAVNHTGGQVAFDNISVFATSSLVTATALEDFRFVICPGLQPLPGQSLCTILIRRDAIYRLEQ